MELLRRLEVLEQTSDRIVVQENPHPLIGSMFIAFGTVGIIGFISEHRRPSANIGGAIVVGVTAILLIALGLSALIRSVVSLDRNAGILRVRRRVLGIDIEKHYEIQRVKQVFERQTRKGNGLRLELSDGRKKNLTLWTEYRSLTKEVGAFNHLIHAIRTLAVSNRDGTQRHSHEERVS
jgi:hypothetical protein